MKAKKQMRESTSEKDSLPLFIVGAPRSGTSLIRDLLRLCAANVYLPPDEIQIIKPFMLLHKKQNKKKLIKLLNSSTFAFHMKNRSLWTEKGLTDLIDLKKPDQSLKQLVVSLASKEGVTSPQYWGDKTPENIFIMDLLLEFWPDLKIIFVSRDPRDTVLSMSRAWGRSISRGAILWRNAFRLASDYKRKLGPKQFYEIKYEELTINPNLILNDVASWLKTPCDTSMLDKYRTQERWGRAKGTTGINSHSIDNWKHSLSKRQIKKIEKILYYEMISGKYQPQIASSAKNISDTQIYLLKIVDGIKSFQAYARERGVKNAFSYKITQWLTIRH